MKDETSFRHNPAEVSTQVLEVYIYIYIYIERERERENDFVCVSYNIFDAVIVLVRRGYMY